MILYIFCVYKHCDAQCLCARRTADWYMYRSTSNKSHEALSCTARRIVSSHSATRLTRNVRTAYTSATKPMQQESETNRMSTKPLLPTGLTILPHWVFSRCHLLL